MSPSVLVIADDPRSPMPERRFAPPAWSAALVVAALLGGATTLLDAWSQVAADQSRAAQRGAVVLALALVALVAAAPGAVALVKSGERGRRRLAVVVGFVAFDLFLALSVWRWRRGILLPVPPAAVLVVGLASLALLVVSVRSSGGGRPGTPSAEGEWG